MSRALFLADSPQRFKDQILFANEISKKGVDVVFFVSETVCDRYPEIIFGLEFKIINEAQKSKEVKKNYILSLLIDNLSDRQKSSIVALREAIYDSFFFESKVKKREEKYFRSLKNKYTKLTKLIAENDINVVFVNGDRHLGYEPIFLSISKLLSIPIVIPYMVYFSEKEGLAKNGFKALGTILSSQYSKNSQERFSSHRVDNRFYYPNYIANSLNRLGVLTDNPWFMGGGSSNIVCLPNLHMKNHYIKNAISENKIKVVGDIAYDTLYHSTLKKQTIRLTVVLNYYLDVNKKNIIIALPQLGEHGILSWKEHWKEIAFLMDNVNSLNQNILISLHPKMDKNSYIFLEKKYNCRILNENLLDILVAADMFVATFSSTVLWSTLCGIKTAVVDFYGLNYSMYDFLTSVEKIDNKKNLKKILLRVLSSQVDFTCDWEMLSKEKVFDGNTAQRYVDLIAEVVKK